MTGQRKIMLGKLYVCEAVDIKWQREWMRETEHLLGHEGVGWKLIWQPEGGASAIGERIRTMNGDSGWGVIDGVVISKGMLHEGNSYGRGYGGQEGGGVWPGLIRDDIITRYIELDLAHSLGLRIGSVHSWMVRGQEIRANGKQSDGLGG